jgi:hypothetical protein
MRLAEAIAQYRDHAPEDIAKVRWYYQVGVLAWPAFTNWIVYAEAAGVTVHREHRRGVLVREGWITLEGRWRAVHRFLRLWQRLTEEEHTDG